MSRAKIIGQDMLKGLLCSAQCNVLNVFILFTWTQPRAWIEQSAQCSMQCVELDWTVCAVLNAMCWMYLFPLLEHSHVHGLNSLRSAQCNVLNVFISFTWTQAGAWIEQSAQCSMQCVECIYSLYLNTATCMNWTVCAVLKQCVECIYSLYWNTATCMDWTVCAVLNAMCWMYLFCFPATCMDWTVCAVLNAMCWMYLFPLLEHRQVHGLNSLCSAQCNVLNVFILFAWTQPLAWIEPSVQCSRQCVECIYSLYWNTATCMDWTVCAVLNAMCWMYLFPLLEHSHLHELNSLRRAQGNVLNVFIPFIFPLLEHRQVHGLNSLRSAQCNVLNVFIPFIFPLLEHRQVHGLNSLCSAQCNVLNVFILFAWTQPLAWIEPSVQCSRQCVECIYSLYWNTATCMNWTVCAGLKAMCWMYLFPLYSLYLNTGRCMDWTVCAVLNAMCWMYLFCLLEHSHVHGLNSLRSAQCNVLNVFILFAWTQPLAWIEQSVQCSRQCVECIYSLYWNTATCMDWTVCAVLNAMCWMYLFPLLEHRQVHGLNSLCSAQCNVLNVFILFAWTQPLAWIEPSVQCSRQCVECIYSLYWNTATCMDWTVCAVLNAMCWMYLFPLLEHRQVHGLNSLRSAQCNVLNVFILFTWTQPRAWIEQSAQCSRQCVECIYSLYIPFTWTQPRAWIEQSAQCSMQCVECIYSLYLNTGRCMDWTVCAVLNAMCWMYLFCLLEHSHLHGLNRLCSAQGNVLNVFIPFTGTQPRAWIEQSAQCSMQCVECIYSLYLNTATCMDWTVCAVLNAMCWMYLFPLLEHRQVHGLNSLRSAQCNVLDICIPFTWTQPLAWIEQSAQGSRQCVECIYSLYIPFTWTQAGAWIEQSVQCSMQCVECIYSVCLNTATCMDWTVCAVLKAMCWMYLFPLLEHSHLHELNSLRRAQGNVLNVFIPFIFPLLEHRQVHGLNSLCSAQCNVLNVFILFAWTQPLAWIEPSVQCSRQCVECIYSLYWNTATCMDWTVCAVLNAMCWMYLFPLLEHSHLHELNSLRRAQGNVLNVFIPFIFPLLEHRQVHGLNSLRSAQCNVLNVFILFTWTQPRAWIEQSAQCSMQCVECIYSLYWNTGRCMDWTVCAVLNAMCWIYVFPLLEHSHLHELNSLRRAQGNVLNVFILFAWTQPLAWIEPSVQCSRQCVECIYSLYWNTATCMDWTVCAVLNAMCWMYLFCLLEHSHMHGLNSLRSAQCNVLNVFISFTWTQAGAWIEQSVQCSMQCVECIYSVCLNTATCMDWTVCAVLKAMCWMYLFPLLEHSHLHELNSLRRAQGNVLNVFIPFIFPLLEHRQVHGLNSLRSAQCNVLNVFILFTWTQPHAWIEQSAQCSMQCVECIYSLYWNTATCMDWTVCAVLNAMCWMYLFCLLEHSHVHGLNSLRSAQCNVLNVFISFTWTQAGAWIEQSVQCSMQCVECIYSVCLNTATCMDWTVCAVLKAMCWMYLFPLLEHSHVHGLNSLRSAQCNVLNVFISFTGTQAGAWIEQSAQCSMQCVECIYSVYLNTATCMDWTVCTVLKAMCWMYLFPLYSLYLNTATCMDWTVCAVLNAMCWMYLFCLLEHSHLHGLNRLCSAQGNVLNVFIPFTGTQPRAWIEQSAQCSMQCVECIYSLYWNTGRCMDWTVCAVLNAMCWMYLFCLLEHSHVHGLNSLRSAQGNVLNVFISFTWTQAGAWIEQSAQCSMQCVECIYFLYLNTATCMDWTVCAVLNAMCSMYLFCLLHATMYMDCTLCAVLNAKCSEPLSHLTYSSPPKLRWIDSMLWILSSSTSWIYSIYSGQNKLRWIHNYIE